MEQNGLDWPVPIRINSLQAVLKTFLPTEVIPFLKVFFEKEKVAGFVVGKPLQKDGTPAPVEEPRSVLL